MAAKKAFSGHSELVFHDGIPGELYYFAYGSDMNKEQISARCAKPEVVAVAKLADHQLDFFGYSAVWDGGEECVVPASGQEVWGVVYKLSASDRARLDDVQDARLDGSGTHFHSPAKVSDQQGNVYSSLLFKKASLGAPQKPSREYLDFILQGAVDHELPSAYVETLRAMESKNAKFAVPRGRKTSGGGCSECGDEPSSASGPVINISLG
jgi:hypothetical protein